MSPSRFGAVAGLCSTSLLLGTGALTAQPAQRVATVKSVSLGCGSTGINPEIFNQVLNRSLSAFANAQATGTPGRFVGVDVQNGTASVAHTIVPKNMKGIVTIAVTGGASEGALALLDGTRLSPRLGTSLTWHVMAAGPRSIDFKTSACNKLRADMVSANLARDLRFIDIDANADVVKRVADKRALDAKADSINGALGMIATNATPAEQARAVELRRDSTRVALRRGALDSMPATERFEARNDARRAARKAIASAIEQLPIEGVALSWLSFGLSSENIRFTLYDPARMVGSPFAAQSVNHYAANASYTRLRHSGFGKESHYVSVNLRTGLESNFGALSRRDLVDRTQLAPPPNERYTERKRTVYQGAFDRHVSFASVSGDYYQYVSRAVAVHLFPAYSARQGSMGEASAGFGVFLSAREADSPASRSNIELFYNVPDLTNSRNSPDRLLKRGAVGLRFAFPLAVPKGE